MATQSAQISSSQGFADGSAERIPAKEPKFSERIKALEALVAKQNDPDAWNDGGLLHFKERHFEKSPTESSRFQKKEVFPDQDSPESPFEVLGDTRRGSDFEDTADWMRAHLPPAPNFETVPELSSSGPSDFVASEGCDFEETQAATALVASVPDAFMDVPADPSLQKDHISESAKRPSTEEDSEFDLSFLPTAYIWDKQEKTDPETQVPTNVPMLHDSKPSPSPPPPAGFGSPTPPPSPPSLDLETSELKPTPQSSDSEPAEIIDMESSGESDDTVIEDAVPVLATVLSLSSPVAVSEGLVSVTPSVPDEPCPQDIPQDLFSGFSKKSSDTPLQLQELEPDNGYSEEQDDSTEFEKLREEPTSLYGGDILSPLESGLVFSADVNQQKSEAEEHPPETSDPESVEPECSVSATTDSFVEFMRECLKSQQGEDPIDICTHYTSRMEIPKTGAPSSQSSPTMVLDLEQECLTIRALKELGSSQEDEDLPVPDMASQVIIGQEEKYPLPASELQTTVTRTPSPVSPLCTPPLDASAVEEVVGIDAWVADAYYLAEHVLAAVLTHLSAKDLVYWRDPKKSGVVFGVSLLLLLSLAAFSVISVVSYLLLALLCVTISFRIYKSIIQAVQKSSEGHPFRSFMDKDVSVPPETFRKHVDVCLSYINRALKLMSRLFLVEDLVDSLKVRRFPSRLTALDALALAVAMWLLTYVGAVFNGITVLILADILIFTLPLVYEKNKTQIDNYVGIVRTQFNSMVSKIQEKLPGVKRKAE
ncbi:reticulon-4-like [Scleropages formosus]|uniref:Reticulon n=1 Tax=Scleropages formosus TaxID=113540 RepID=A0A0P7X743_SCLFO|nr:reticulon-4-like [Scleropages formosus]